MALTIFLLGILLTGLVLIAVGAILLFAIKNKLAGMVVGAIGIVFTLFSVGIFLLLTISSSSMG